MNKIIMVMIMASVWIIIGCGESDTTSSYDEKSNCSQSLTDNDTVNTVEINTSGAIGFDCINDIFHIGGADSMTINNRSFEINSTATFKDGSSWQGSELLNEAEGIYQLRGTHTTLGAYDCTIAYKTLLPTIISNDDTDSIANVIYDTDVVSSDSGSEAPIGDICPDWIDDGTLENNIISSETSAQYLLTDNSAKVHTITQHNSKVVE